MMRRRERSDCLLLAIFASLMLLLGPAHAQETKPHLQMPECIFDGSCWSSDFLPESTSASVGAKVSSPEGSDHEGYERLANDLIQALIQEQANCAAENAIDTHSSKEEQLKFASCFLTDEQILEWQTYPDDPVGLHPDSEGAEFTKYYASEKFALCGASFTLIDGVGRGNRLDISREVATSIFNVYLRNCFSEPKEEADRPYRDRIGFLVATSGNSITDLFCTGFLIGSDLLLTAKHCFISKINIVELQRSKSNIEITIDPDLVQRFQVLLPSISPFFFNLSVPSGEQIDQSLAYDPNAPESDLILVKVSGIGQDLEAFPLAHPKKWEALSLYGLYVDNLNNVNRRIRNEPVTNVLDDYLLLDESLGCYAAHITADGCIAHGCQTFKGFSGTPLFLNRDGTNQLAGVQSGAMPKVDNACDFKRATIYRNMAVSAKDFVESAIGH